MIHCRGRTVEYDFILRHKDPRLKKIYGWIIELAFQKLGNFHLFFKGITVLIIDFIKELNSTYQHIVHLFTEKHYNYSFSRTIYTLKLVCYFLLKEYFKYLLHIF